MLTLPDPLLKRVAQPVGGVDRELAADLCDTMAISPGCVGLAAPQIGIERRAFALDVSAHPRGQPNHGLVVLFDPELVVAEGFEVRREGCLSVPHLTANVRRALHIVVRGLGLDGAAHVIEASGFEARAFQHELDHLDGLLILDRVAFLRTDVFPRKTYQPRRD